MACYRCPASELTLTRDNACDGPQSVARAAKSCPCAHAGIYTLPLTDLNSTARNCTNSENGTHSLEAALPARAGLLRSAVGTAAALSARAGLLRSAAGAGIAAAAEGMLSLLDGLLRSWNGVVAAATEALLSVRAGLLRSAAGVVAAVAEELLSLLDHMLRSVVGAVAAGVATLAGAAEGGLLVGGFRVGDLGGDVAIDAALTAATTAGAAIGADRVRCAMTPSRQRMHTKPRLCRNGCCHTSCRRYGDRMTTLETA